MSFTQKAVVMDGDGLRRAINRIAYEIIEKNRGAKDVTLIGIKRRGAVIADRIADKIAEVEGVRPPTENIDITMYRDDIEKEKREQRGKFKIKTEINGRVVVIVDDVIYTGRTSRAAIEAVFDSGRAKKIQLAAIIDRGHRELPIRPDYVGKNLPTSLSEKVNVLVNEYDGFEGTIITEEK